MYYSVIDIIIRNRRSICQTSLYNNADLAKISYHKLSSIAILPQSNVEREIKKKIAISMLATSTRMHNNDKRYTSAWLYE